MQLIQIIRERTIMKLMIDPEMKNPLENIPFVDPKTDN